MREWVGEKSGSRAVIAAWCVLVIAPGCVRELPVVDAPPASNDSRTPTRERDGAAGGKTSADDAMPAEDNAAAGPGAESPGAAGSGSASPQVPASSPSEPDPSEPDPSDEDAEIVIPFTEAMFNAVPTLDCAGAVAPTLVAMEPHTEAIAVTSDSLIFGAQSGIWRLPKDGSAPAMELPASTLGIPSLAVLGDTVYFWSLSLNSIKLGDREDTDVPSVLDDGFDAIFATDETAVYAITPDGSVDALVIIAPDGTTEEVEIVEPTAIAARGGTAFVLSPFRNSSLYKIGPDRVPQLLSPALRFDDDLAVTERYVYSWIFPTSGSYLVRIPIQGGTPELLARAPGLTGELHATEHEVLLEHLNGAGQICVLRFDEATGTVSGFADTSNVWQMAHDDTHFYFANNALYKIPR